MRTIRETCVAGAVIDRTVKGTRSGNGFKRRPKMNHTPEAVQKNNDRLATKRLARLVNANFIPGDYHVTLTYAEAVERDEAEVDLRNFLRRMKREYKKLDKEFKYVAVTEYKNTRIHHHVLMSYIELSIINEQWKNGRILSSTLDKSRNYRKLAEYLIKETTKTFREAGNATKRRYTCSRNLERPIVITQEVPTSELFADPKEIKGYALDEDSVRRFDNPITGLTHLEYSMVSTDPVPRLKKWRNGEVKTSHEHYMGVENNEQLELDLLSWGTI